MTVYVDNMRTPYGRMKMCHMVADSVSELLEMADRIGVDRKWFQAGSHPHFDICVSKRKEAIRHGAQPVGRREIVAVIRRHRAKIDADPVEFAAVRTAKWRRRKPGDDCSTCGNKGFVFECGHWPSCDCPGGTTIPGCPGRTVPCPDCKSVSSERG